MYSYYKLSIKFIFYKTINLVCFLDDVSFILLKETGKLTLQMSLLEAKYRVAFDNDSVKGITKLLDKTFIN